MSITPKAANEEGLVILVITDDDELLKRAHRQLADCHLIHRRTNSIPKNLKFDLCIIDARSLEPESCRKIYNLGSSKQRIALGDPKLDNRLASIHSPFSSSLRSSIMTCLQLARTIAAPRGLRQELSGLPFE